MPAAPRRILIVKPTALGDVVQSLPIAGLIKRAWPDTHVAWVIARPFAALLETHPHVDAVVEFDRLRNAGPVEQAKATRAIVKTLRGGDYDLAIDLQGLFRSGWLTWRSGAKRRVGFAYAREAAPRFYNDHVAAREPGRNAAERYLDVAEHLGLGRSPADACITTTSDDDAVVDALLAPLAGRPFVVLLPGTNWATKRWPASSFAALARKLGPERVVIAGANDAAEAATQIEGLNLVGQTSVRELASLIRRADLVVANDSGPMHLAAALGRPLVALFGPTDPRLTGPWRSSPSVVRLDVCCSPCLSRTCAHQTCLAALHVERVFHRCVAALTSP